MKTNSIEGWRRTIRREGIGILTGALLLLYGSGLCRAEGYRNPPASASSLARSGAATAFINDPSTVALNPANMAMMSSSEGQIAINAVNTRVTFNPADGANSVKSPDNWQFLPNFFGVFPLKENERGMTAGLGLTTPYGQSVEWPEHGALQYSVPYSIRMRLLNVNPAFAMQLTPTLFIGVGADLFLSDLRIERLADNGPAPADADITMDGDGHGWGGNIGLTWLMLPGQRIALTYRSTVKVDYSGDTDVSNLDPRLPASSGFDTEIKFPNIIAAAYGFEYSEELRFEVDVEWLEYSVNDTMPLDVGAYNPLMPREIRNDWKDTWTLGISGEWDYSPEWTFRAGYAFLESPIPDETFTPALPDSDRHVLSIGAGWAKGPHAIDLAYSYSIYEDRDISNNQNPALNGNYEFNSFLAGASYNLKF